MPGIQSVFGQFTALTAVLIGAFLFWVARKRWPDPESRGNQAYVQNQETICAGTS